MEGRTLSETRRAARRLVEAVVAGAFPDRPAADPTGTWEVLEFRLDVRLRLDDARRHPARSPSRLEGAPPVGRTSPRRSGNGAGSQRFKDASGASAP